jgi:hypothetical protein
MLHHWTSHGAITPTVSANGPGSRAGWNTRDIRILCAIGHVTTDLHNLGLQPTTRFVARLWDALNTDAHVDITQRSVSISIGAVDAIPAHLGSETG